MNIRNINSLPSIGTSQAPVFRPAKAENEPLSQDSVRVNGALQAAEPKVKQKSLAECRDEFKARLSKLKYQNDDDKAAVRELAQSVNDRTDLNSKEKEWLFANEMMAYTADIAMQMTGWEKKGQPWTPKQQERFEAITETFAAAKGVSEAVTPLVEKPDVKAPAFEAENKAESKAEGTTKSAEPSANTPPPANEGSSDPIVRIWESRRQEAQDVFNDYKAMMQKITEWKQRIMASRLAFFWKVYGMHAGVIGETWRK
ncbi:hypothetical protein IV102_09735 [bacterium]|nr:hypothetical protein [bacterium]